MYMYPIYIYIKPTYLLFLVYLYREVIYITLATHLKAYWPVFTCLHTQLILTMCTKRRVDFPLLCEWVDCKQMTITKESSRETQDKREAHFISYTIKDFVLLTGKNFLHTEKNILSKENWKVPDSMVLKSMTTRFISD